MNLAAEIQVSFPRHRSLCLCVSVCLSGHTQPKDSPAYKLFSGTKDSYFTGYTNFQNTTMQPAFERIPDWANQSNFAVPADGSSAAADGSPVSASGVASGEMSDAAVLRRVVPTLGETEAQNLLAANAGDLQASMKAALNLLAKL